MATNTNTPDQHRAEARAHFQNADDSFERCDTDGALTQWASTACGYKALAEAELAEAGGRAEFLALFRQTDDGWELLDAKLRSGRYGLYWSLPGGGFLNHPKRQATLRKKGYQVGLVRRPAGVDQHFSCVGAAPTTYYYPTGGIDEAEIITDGSDTTSTTHVLNWTGGDHRPAEINAEVGRFAPGYIN